MGHRTDELINLIQLPITLCSQLAFACNRRVNGDQLKMGVTFLACGISERINAYLHSVGLTCSRKTALRAIEHLTKVTEKKTRDILSRKHLLRPFLCVDNIDFESKVHNKRIEETTKPFHGTWGYFHVLPEILLPEVDRYELSLASCAESMAESVSRPVHVESFFPNVREAEHWGLTLKSQLSVALIGYILPKDSKTAPQLEQSPPLIDQIDLHAAEIRMLRMMDASDNSAEGVGQMLEQIASQLRADGKDLSELLQILEGDLGTNMNIESLRKKRHPAGHLHEALQYILTVPGAAHTLWNVAQAVLIHHWGREKNYKDNGAWKTWVALGGTCDKPVSKKDFNSIMVMIHKIHTATMISCLEYVVRGFFKFMI